VRRVDRHDVEHKAPLRETLVPFDAAPSRALVAGKLTRKHATVRATLPGGKTGALARIFVGDAAVIYPTK
jgi:hypothetical protein